jgi:hypothetical protein
VTEKSWSGRADPSVWRRSVPFWRAGVMLGSAFRVRCRPLADLQEVARGNPASKPSIRPSAGWRVGADASLPASVRWVNTG